MGVIAQLTATMGMIGTLVPAQPSSVDNCRNIESEQSRARSTSTQAPARTTNANPYRHVPTAAIASPEWLQARNQYIDHLMGCKACHAPTGRYCNIGGHMLQQYNQTPL